MLPSHAELNTPRYSPNRTTISSGSRTPGQIGGEGQGQQEAVAPHALKKVRPHHVIQNAARDSCRGSDAMLREAEQVGIFQIRRDRLVRRSAARLPARAHARRRCGAMVLLIRYFCLAAFRSALGSTHSHTFPSTCAKEFLGRGMCHQRPLRDQRNVGGGGFDVGNDVRRKNHDALAGKIREQIAKAHALFGIEPGRRFIDDQQLRIVEQRLRDSDALLHSAGEAAERPLA